MAESSAGERTEKPTADRLRKAREEGKIPQSQEVPSAMMVGMLLLVFVLLAGSLYRWFLQQVQMGLSFSIPAPMEGGALAKALNIRAGQAMMIMAPFMLAAVAVSFLGSVLSSGFSFSPKAIGFKFSKIGFGGGFKNLISLKSGVHLLTSVVKVTVLSLIVWNFFKDKLDSILALQWAHPEATLVTTGRLLLGVVGRITLALLAIAGLDLLYQRWNYLREMKMTRQEVKEENKQHELSPMIRGRIRARQMTLASKRMLKEVPTADVVVVNPTHVAVAMKYNPAAMAAPQVVAKGADFMCEKIKEIAREHNIPIVEKPELARAIYAAVEVGQPIPESLFVAVAEILAMIYRLRRRRQKN